MLFFGPHLANYDQISVVDFFAGGSQALELIAYHLSAEILLQIQAIPHSLFSSRPDSISWKDNKKGEFSPTIAYRLAKHFPPVYQEDWMWI
ncbi:hypothetical protein SLA2020_013690 [Shorea laevis]